MLLNSVLYCCYSRLSFSQIFGRYFSLCLNWKLIFIDVAAFSSWLLKIGKEKELIFHWENACSNMWIFVFIIVEFPFTRHNIAYIRIGPNTKMIKSNSMQCLLIKLHCQIILIDKINFKLGTDNSWRLLELKISNGNSIEIITPLPATAWAQNTIIHIEIVKKWLLSRSTCTAFSEMQEENKNRRVKSTKRIIKCNDWY